MKSFPADVTDTRFVCAFKRQKGKANVRAIEITSR
jgi:hypothetical protein